MRLSLYRPAGSVLHRLDPRAKLVALGGVEVALFLVSRHAWLLAPALAVFALAAAGRVLRPFLVLAAAVAVLGTVSMLFGMALLAARGHGGAAGWLYGSAMALRLGDLLLAGLLLLLVTRMEELLAAATRMKLPYPVVFVLGLTLRLVPALLATANHVVEAQRLRGLRFDEGGLVTRARRYLPLLVPILAGALRGAHQMAWALEAKGFGARRTRTQFLDLAFRPADYLAMGLGAACALGALAAWLTGLGQLGITGF